MNGMKIQGILEKILKIIFKVTVYSKAQISGIFALRGIMVILMIIVMRNSFMCTQLRNGDANVEQPDAKAIGKMCPEKIKILFKCVFASNAKAIIF